MITTKLPILSEDITPIPSDRQKIKSAIASLQNRYSTIVKTICALMGMSDFEWLVWSVMYKENGTGNASFVKSTGATGLMQVTPETASDCIIRENQKKRLTQAEKDFLSKKIGETRVKSIAKRKQLGNPILITQADLKDPEINVFFGVLYLGQLVDECTENGELRLDFLCTRYLRYYSRPKGANAEQVIAWVNGQESWSKSQRSENIGYIKALGGKNGIATLVTT